MFDKFQAPPVNVVHLGNYFVQIGASANLKKINQFGNFKTISCTNFKLKGGLFLAENLGPQNAGHFGQMGVTANQPNLANFKNFKQFPVQNPN